MCESAEETDTDTDTGTNADIVGSAVGGTTDAGGIGRWEAIAAAVAGGAGQLRQVHQLAAVRPARIDTATLASLTVILEHASAAAAAIEELTRITARAAQEDWPLPDEHPWAADPQARAQIALARASCEVAARRLRHARTALSTAARATAQLTTTTDVQYLD